MKLLSNNERSQLSDSAYRMAKAIWGEEGSQGLVASDSMAAAIELLGELEEGRDELVCLKELSIVIDELRAIFEEASVLFLSELFGPWGEQDEHNRELLNYGGDWGPMQ